MRGGARWGLWVGACAASLGVLGGLAMPARSAPAGGTPARIVGYAPTGSLTYRWQAEPALGCAAEGVCGVVGSLTIRVGNYATGSSAPNPPVELQDGQAVARSVQMTSSGQSQEVCADPEAVDLELSILPGGAGRQRAVLGGQQFGSLPSAGTCAGPTQEDLSHLALPVRSLGRRGYEIAGSDSFGAGPFEVTATARIRAAFTGQGGGGPVLQTLPPGSGATPTHLRHLLEETASVSYRLQSAQGSLGASFSGGPDPFCQALGTCGSQGSLALTLAPHGQRLTLEGARLVRRPVGERAAVRDLLAGRLGAGDNAYALKLSSTVAGALQATGDGFDCHDTLTTSAPLLQSSVTPRALMLSLEVASPFFGLDPLRTRCPGPAGSDVIEGGSFAAPATPLEALDSPTLTVTLAGSGAFSGDGYAGMREGTIRLTLTRAGQTGGTRRITERTVGR